MSRILPIDNLKKKTDQNYNSSLIISDLDTFFKEIYEYYYNRGYNNILIGTILDNISYLFSIHFVIINIFFVNWKEILKFCIKDNECDLELTNFLNFHLRETNTFFFTIFYGLLIIYYILFFYKSCKFLCKMKYIKNIFYNKLHIKQKEMENIKFDEIMEKVIQLQINENFCRIKENISKYDIIARIMRKENFLLGMVLNNVVDFKIKIPFLGELNLFSNYLYNNLSEYLLNITFTKGEVNINSNFYNLRSLQLKLISYMILEIIFIPPVIFFKLIFWIFKNAENIKSNRNNITQQNWSSYIQIIFRNFNELEHHFENRINNSYPILENFLSCFKCKKISIIGKFFTITCGSFIVLIFIITSIEGRLLTELKIFGHKLVYVAFIVGIILNFFSKDNNKSENDHIENLNLKETYYKQFINKVINIPDEFRNKKNFSSVYNQVHQHYEYGFVTLLKEILSIILFPYFWLVLIVRAPGIIKFFKSNSKLVEGLGHIYTYSYMELAHFKSLKEKDYNINDVSIIDKKFINSFLYYNDNFKCSNENNYTMTEDSNPTSDIEVESKMLENDLFEYFKKENCFNGFNAYNVFTY